VILLDTNVVSALMRPSDNPAVVSWLDRQAAVSIWTTAITVLEIRFGLQVMANRRRRKALEQAFAAFIHEDLPRYRDCRHRGFTACGRRDKKCEAF
jgi:predicted nucleic acid-binding protein